MKKLFFSLIAIALWGSVVQAQDQRLNKNDLPEFINVYVAKNYADAKISKAKLDVDTDKTTYEVKLKDRTELEFDIEGSIIQIEQKKPIAAHLLPSKIVDYVTEHYPKMGILEWKLEKNKGKQEIKLTNRIELEFDLDGNFIKID